MRPYLLLLLLLLALPVLSQSKKEESFQVILFGDMPYTLPEDYGRFENLIKTVNAQKQVFNVHVGDIKSSSTPCSEAYYTKIQGYFEQFTKPLVYTPGDNEWTDCNKKEAGSYDPEERLTVIRKMFFKDNQSWGKEKMTLITQSSNPEFATFVENRRWDYRGIAFATLHVVGSDNNFLAESKNFNKEFYARNKADLAWLEEIFAQATKNKQEGIVIFIHADMFNGDKGDVGFQPLLKELKRHVLEFGRPVLLVNGDSHQFLVDKPIQKKPKVKEAVPNFTRLQVFGENEMHAVRLIITPGTAGLFQIEQLLVEGN